MAHYRFIRRQAAMTMRCRFPGQSATSKVFSAVHAALNQLPDDQQNLNCFIDQPNRAYWRGRAQLYYDIWMVILMLSQPFTGMLENR